MLFNESQINKQVSVGVCFSPCWETQDGTSLALIALVAGGHMGNVLYISQLYFYCIIYLSSYIDCELVTSSRVPLLYFVTYMNDCAEA